MSPKEIRYIEKLYEYHCYKCNYSEFAPADIVDEFDIKRKRKKFQLKNNSRIKRAFHEIYIDFEWNYLYT